MSKPPSLSNLPAALSSFVGRERECDEVKRLLLATRLLTLTGPGGCGKSRLALQAAVEWRSESGAGVWWVALDALTAAELVPQTVVRALGLPQEGTGDPLDLLLQSLRAQHLLLILDNCEHLIDACAALAATLLQHCPHLRLLTTSREALLITGETVWAVPPLSLQAAATPSASAPGKDRLLHSEAERLFIERARAVTPGFAANAQNTMLIHTICRQLDGMPLAIELAAARTRALSVEQIAMWLSQPLERSATLRQLLAGQNRTAPRRHQSLQAALDWSDRLLTAEERLVWQKLAVFAGGCTLAAAEAVCAEESVGPGGLLEILTRLIDKSLLTMQEQGGVARYRMAETIRQYAYDKLVETGQVDGAHRRHLHYFLALVEQAQRHFTSATQRTGFQQVEQEVDNLRVALERIVAGQAADADQSASGLRLCSALEIFWGSRGSTMEGVEWLHKLLAQPITQSEGLRLRRAQALNALCTLEMIIDSDVNVVQAHAAEAYDLGQQVGAAAVVAAALRNLGVCAFLAGSAADAQALLAQSLALWQQVDAGSGAAGQHGFAWTRLYQAAFALRSAAYDTAAATYGACVQIFRQLGDANFLALALRGQGNASLRLGDIANARALLQESLQLNLALNSWRGIVACLTSIAATLAANGDGCAAARLFGATETLLLNVTTALPMTDRVQWEHTQQLIHHLLDEESLQAARAEGRTLTLQQVVDVVFTADQPPRSEAVATPVAPPIGNGKNGLSAREAQVAALLAQGKSNREIAEQLVVGVKSVETYVTRILNKLGLSSRLQVALWAVEQGVGAPTATPDP